MPDSPQWTTHPDADGIVHELVGEALASFPSGAAFADRLLGEAGIRITDVLDHVRVVSSGALERRLVAAGFTIEDGTTRVARHAGGLFPSILLAEHGPRALSVKVESVADFLAAHGLDRDIVGAPLSPYRSARAWWNDDVELCVVERHGHVGFDPSPASDAERLASARHFEAFRLRRRLFDDQEEGFDHTDALIEGAVAELGGPWACALFLRAERCYWESRNAAGRLQKARQDALGIGWANDDHHTYDASREWFHRTIRALELLGFRCRERFYAGAEAGWGSQILEHPVLGTVVFADIDLAPDELAGDFAHARLAPLPKLRRAGLWCALHGESMLEAGINHLECMYDAAALRAQLEARGVALMAPFTDMPHLYQQLTVGEWWPVREDRVRRLLAAGQITAGEAADFRARGAIGSHLENLERNGGYKGFNQPGISQVLRIIDPRENLAPV